MSDAIPKLVNDALQNLVRAINDTSPRCIGVVAVVVFDDCQIVLPVIDKNARVVSGVNPVYALIDTAAQAITDRLTTTPREISPEKLQ